MISFIRKRFQSVVSTLCHLGMLIVYYVIDFFRKCIKCVRENISYFYIVLISVCLINLLGGVLADKIFIDLWNLLELKEGRSLQFLIYTFCLGFVYYGWHFSKKHIDSQYISINQQIIKIHRIALATTFPISSVNITGSGHFGIQIILIKLCVRNKMCIRDRYWAIAVCGGE